MDRQTLILSWIVCVATIITLAFVLKTEIINRIKLSAELIFKPDGNIRLKFINSGNQSALIKNFDIIEIKSSRKVFSFSDVSDNDIPVPAKHFELYTFVSGSVFDIEYKNKYSINITVRKRYCTKDINLVLNNTYGNSIGI